MLLNLNGSERKGASIFFASVNDKEEMRAVYADEACKIPHPNPMQCDADGKFPTEIHFLGGRDTYQIFVQDDRGRNIFEPEKKESEGTEPPTE